LLIFAENNSYAAVLVFAVNCLLKHRVFPCRNTVVQFSILPSLI
jgi:hypothetical protein